MSDMLCEIPYTQPQKLPTLIQFLESDKSVKLKVKYPVFKIWFPNKFPALCLETEDFRVNVDEANPMFESLESLCRKVTQDDLSIAIVVNPDRDGGFGITTMGTTGTWETIGKTGWKFVINKTQKRPQTKRGSA